MKENNIDNYGDRMALDTGHDKISSRLKILDCAVNLFARKGYTETSIRELATAVGLKGGSIYSHFSSKNAILECILEDYSARNTRNFDAKAAFSTLKENPTIDGIMACMRLSYPTGKDEYYLKVICVILQEQHRNPVMRDFMSKRLILSVEDELAVIIQVMKELDIIRKDTDPDFWVKTGSSLIYAFANRMMLGIGDRSLNFPDMGYDGTANFSGMCLADLLKYLFTMMLKTCGVERKR